MTPTADPRTSLASTSVAANSVTATGSPLSASPAALLIATATPSAPNPTIAPTAVPMISVVSNAGADPINIRDAPSANGTVLQTLAPGQEVQSAATTTPGTDDGAAWLSVMYDRDNVGYVRADLVSAPVQRVAPTPTPIPPTRSPAQATADAKAAATGTAASVGISASSTAYAVHVAETAVAVANSPSGWTLAQWQAKTKSIDPGDLAKRPDAYKGAVFSVSGKATNVRESGGKTTFQIQGETNTGLIQFIYVVCDGTFKTLQSGQNLEAYGIGSGTVSGTNGFGAAISQPAMVAYYIGPPR